MNPVSAGLATIRIERLAASGFFLDLVAFRRGALVVPEQGRADDLARLIEEHRPMHLAAEPDAGDVGRRGTSPPPVPRRRSVRSPATRARDPARTSPGRGWSHGYWPTAEARIVPRLVDGQRLRPGRPDVDAQGDAHGLISQRSPQRQNPRHDPAREPAGLGLELRDGDRVEGEHVIMMRHDESRPDRGRPGRRPRRPTCCPARPAPGHGR